MKTTFEIDSNGILITDSENGYSFIPNMVI